MWSLGLWSWYGCWLIWIFQKLLISWDRHAQLTLEFTYNGAKKPSNKHKSCGKRLMVNALLMREVRLVQADRKATVTQTILINSSEQNNISEHISPRGGWPTTVEESHRVPLLSAMNSILKLQCVQGYQNLNIFKTTWFTQYCSQLMLAAEDRKKTWSCFSNLSTWTEAPDLLTRRFQEHACVRTGVIHPISTLKWIHIKSHGIFKKKFSPKKYFSFLYSEPKNL